MWGLCCVAAPPVVLRNDEIDWEQLSRRLGAGEFDNVVISPGPGTPSCAGDIGELPTRLLSMSASAPPFRSGIHTPCGFG